VSEFVCAHRRVTETAEPGFGELHGDFGVLGVSIGINFSVKALFHWGLAGIFAKVDLWSI
jgi:hypothetical protein